MYKMFPLSSADAIQAYIQTEENPQREIYVKPRKEFGQDNKSYENSENLYVARQKVWTTEAELWANI